MDSDRAVPHRFEPGQVVQRDPALGNGLFRVEEARHLDRPGYVLAPLHPRTGEPVQAPRIWEAAEALELGPDF